MKPNWSGSKSPFGVLIITPALLREKSALKKLKPEAVELRVDLFRHLGLEAVKDLARDFKKMKVSLLLTARRKADGGEWPKNKEAERRAWLLSLVSCADAIDIEANFGNGLEPFLEKLRSASRRTKIIFSFHNMKRLVSGSDLIRYKNKAIKHSAARFKVALTTAKKKDVVWLSSWAKRNVSKDMALTVIAMGKAGQHTRWILPKLLGGPAYAAHGKAVAPGQLSYKDLKTRLGS